ncbi:hypothetical protein [Halorubrum salsamenti]|uniref:hypothetical protein n=1 Tax=Halorubrum salsamenti TaxID=2583990 RepID=UPI0011A00A0A|nr:hypothetical protein [Halorubrum salsamenti]
MTPRRTSRRRFLAGFGAVGTAALAGCSSLPFGDDSRAEQPAVSLATDDVGSVAWPASPFPVPIPGSLAAAHEARVRDLLAEVPTEPSIPNEAVAADLASDRERAAAGVDRAVDDPWPVDALAAWRRRRERAATVRGAYRAATGGGDPATAAERRQTVRADLRAFEADVTYRARSPREAVLAYGPVESLLADCERRVRPTPPYPEDPVADPFRAGEAVGRVETARATLDDAAGLREAYLAERPEATAQWASVAAAAEDLEGSARRTRGVVREALGDGPSGDDVQGTVARELFRETEWIVESQIDDVERAMDVGEYATAVVASGRALAATEAHRAAGEAIREGGYREPVTAESVRTAADRARAAVADIGEAEATRLAAAIGRPALERVRYAIDLVDEGYGSVVRVRALLTHAVLLARAAPEAAAFVDERLR